MLYARGLIVSISQMNNIVIKALLTRDVEDNWRRFFHNHACIKTIKR